MPLTGEARRRWDRERYAKEYGAKRRAQANAWRQANREKIARYSRERTARKRAAEAATVEPLTPAWQSVLAADPCAYCGGRADGGLDHVVPLIEGGTNDWHNLAPACLRCNKSKQRRSLLVFLQSRVA